MRGSGSLSCTICIALGLLAVSAPVFSQPGDAVPAAEQISQPAKPPMTQEELDQLLAPIALYPDALLSQVLMASTYPLEVVQADRWVQKNKDRTDEDAMLQELEDQPWDPSVKSLINVPQALDMMSSKLDWTIKLGDAFIDQEQDVMNTVQRLRQKAQAAGNLISDEQQTVSVEPATASQPQVIVIQQANPQIIYVPVYNPTVVYGVWWYPAYPPYYYYPPRYVYMPGHVFWYGSGFRIGFAWGYAWGGCNWHHSSVNININRNVNINNKHINYNKYQNNYNKARVDTRDRKTGDWKHDPKHRDGVPYRDQSTSQRFGAAAPAQNQRAREEYRGRTDAGGGNRTGSGAGNGAGNGAGSNNPTPGQRPGNNGGGNSPPQRPANNGSGNSPSQRPANSGNGGGAFDGVNRGGGDARRESQRGNSSRNGGNAGNGNRVPPSGGGGGNLPGNGGGNGAGGGGGGRPRGGS
jgi:hypothetical protein